MKIYCWEGYNQKKFCRNFNQKTHFKSFISDFQIANDIKNRDKKCDIININNAYIRDYLWKYRLIKELNFEKYSLTYSDYLKNFLYLSKWTKTADKKKIIGVGQRFGSLNFVINSQSINKKTAEREGFDLIKDKKNKFGILLFEDFNIMQLCLSSGINPFKLLNESKIKKFKEQCLLWFERASIISDNYFLLNKKLNQKTINLYLTGGTYTCSVSRKAGYDNIISIIPKNKISNLKQGLIFTEITSIIKNSNEKAELFLDFILTNQKSYEIAMSKNTCNPVLQMGNSKIFDLFSNKDLNIIQWDDVQRSSNYSYDYQIVPSYKKLLNIFRKKLSYYQYKIV